MTRTQYISRLRKELHRVNEVIDFKIMNGLRYNEESRKHRVLVERIRAQTRQKYFGRLFGAF